MEILPPEVMEMIFSWTNPEVIKQFKATNKHYYQIFSTDGYAACAAPFDELNEFVEYLGSKVSTDWLTSRHISFAIKKPTIKTIENIPKLIQKICKVKNITSLDLSELTKPDLILNCDSLAELAYLQDLSISAYRYNNLEKLGHLTRLTIRNQELPPQALDSFSNLRELNLLSPTHYNVNRLIQGLVNPLLLTRLHINLNGPLKLPEISRMTNLKDLHFGFTKASPYYSMNDVSSLPIRSTDILDLSLSMPINAEIVAANAHLTRLVLHSSISVDSFQFAKLSNLQELSITDARLPLELNSLLFLQHLKIRSLTVVSSTDNHDFLQYTNEDALKALKIDLLQGRTRLEHISRLTALESLEISLKAGTRTTATKYNVSNLTLLTRLVTPQNFYIIGLDHTTRLIELSTSSAIDKPTLQSLKNLTKLECYANRQSVIDPQSELSTNLLELVTHSDPESLPTLTNLTRLELMFANTCSWTAMLTKLKKLEIMSFVTRSKLEHFTALRNLTYLAIGCSEDLPSTGHPFTLLTKLQMLQLTAVNDDKVLKAIEAKLPCLLSELTVDF